MKNRGHRIANTGLITARVLVGVATLGAVFVLLRSLPDLIRYLRVRRM
jgi:hypothetical protein